MMKLYKKEIASVDDWYREAQMRLDQIRIDFVAILNNQEHETSDEHLWGMVTKTRYAISSMAFLADTLEKAYTRELKREERKRSYTR